MKQTCLKHFLAIMHSVEEKDRKIWLLFRAPSPESTVPCQRWFQSSQAGLTQPFVQWQTP